tara:strand:- start:500 stop:709 length:210 start_codon:yes stop_codon:yes gene_type:complete
MIIVEFTYIVLVFYNENNNYISFQDIIENDGVVENKFIDYIDVNEYTKYLNELNEELDGNFLYEVLEIK